MKFLYKFSLLSAVLGIMSTAILDCWNFLSHIIFDVPLTRYEFIGRWMLHMIDGQFYHQSIKQSSAIYGELVAGWLGHYMIGIFFASLLLGGWGLKWLQRPALMGAMTVSLFTVVIPYFIMQPAMGHGIAGSLTPNPQAMIIKVIALYFAGSLINLVNQLRHKV